MVYYWKKWFVCCLAHRWEATCSCTQKTYRRENETMCWSCSVPSGLMEKPAGKRRCLQPFLSQVFKTSLGTQHIQGKDVLCKHTAFFGFVHLQRLDLHTNKKSGCLCNLLHHLVSRTAQLGASRTPSLFPGPHSLPRLPFGWWAHIYTTVQCMSVLHKVPEPWRSFSWVTSKTQQPFLCTPFSIAEHLANLQPLAHTWWFCGEPAIT